MRSGGALLARELAIVPARPTCGSAGPFCRAPFRRLLPGVVFAALSALAFGCSPGVDWKLDRFEPVHRQAAAKGRLTFAYLRSWASVECTRFEDQVLKNPDVLAETKKFDCVPLEIGVDDELAERWNVRTPPAVIIVDPDGRVLGTLSGSISRDAVLALMRRSQTEFASRTVPVSAKP